MTNIEYMYSCTNKSVPIQAKEFLTKNLLPYVKINRSLGGD